MKYLVLILSVIVFIKTISYGIYEIKKNSNLSRWNFRDNNCHIFLFLSKYYHLF